MAASQQSIDSLRRQLDTSTRTCSELALSQRGAYNHRPTFRVTQLPMSGLQQLGSRRIEGVGLVLIDLGIDTGLIPDRPLTWVDPWISLS